MSIPFILSPDFVTVVSENKPHTIYANDGRFQKLKEALKAKNLAIIPEIISLPRAIALFSAGKVQVFDGEVTYNGKPIHSCLTTRILEFAREGFPFESLVRFMDKLMENPSERSREQLFSYLTLYMLPICEDGDFISQKSVTNDYKDHHTQKVDNSIGKIIEMPREKVDENPNASCSFGYHVGNSGYVSTFSSGRVILCKVNPKDVCSVPHDSSCQKMRVCRYEVISDIGQTGEEKSFTSNYAPDSDVTRDVIKPSDKIVVKVDSNYGEIKNIGADTAYKLWKDDVLVKSAQAGELNQEVDYPRSFFRKYSDWQLA